MRVSKFIQRSALVATFFVAVSSLVIAQSKTPSTYTQLGRDIYVISGQEVAEVTCLGCSIHIRGHVTGDATTVGGSIFVEDEGQVNGDVTTVAGNARLDQDVKVGGDTTVVGGEIRRAAGAQVGGDVTNIAGRAWVPIILVLPFAFLGFMVWLVVWIVRRAAKPAVATAA